MSSFVQQNLPGQVKGVLQATIIDGADAAEVSRRASSTTPLPSQPEPPLFWHQAVAAPFIQSIASTMAWVERTAHSVKQGQVQQQQAIDSYVQDRLANGRDAFGQPIINLVV